MPIIQDKVIKTPGGKRGRDKGKMAAGVKRGFVPLPKVLTKASEDRKG